MNKKLFSSLFLVLLSFVLLVGCNSNQSSGGSEAPAESDGGNQENTGSDSKEEASSYPEKTIEVYIPYSPGGQTDTSARLMAEHISEYLGQKVVIINQTGGNGAVAMDTVLNAKPDGYKLFYSHQAMHTGYATDQYDIKATDYKEITTFTGVNEAYVVRSDAPWDNLKEFVEDAKANPGKYKYGADIGGTTHFMGGMLTNAADIDVKMIPAGGESERMAALLGGQVDVVVTSVGNAATYIESGDYKALAVLTEERDPKAPEIPTAKEQGYDIVFSVVHALFGPADLPADVVQKWNDAAKKLAENEDYLAAVEKIKHVHVSKNAEETEAFVKKEFDYIQELGKKLGY